MIHRFFYLLGLALCLAVLGSCSYSVDSVSPAVCSVPHYTGRIYDCRHGNNEALLVLCQLVGRPTYYPDVSVYQYPDARATMVSLDTETERVNFIFQNIPVTVQSVSGPAPNPTPSMFSLVQR